MELNVFWVHAKIQFCVLNCIEVIDLRSLLSRSFILFDAIQCFADIEFLCHEKM